MSNSIPLNIYNKCYLYTDHKRRQERKSDINDIQYTLELYHSVMQGFQIKWNQLLNNKILHPRH